MDLLNVIPAWYRIPGIIIGVLAFLGIWLYSLTIWGLFGIIFGWIPGLIGGFMLGLLWLPALIIISLLWVFFG